MTWTAGMIALNKTSNSFDNAVHYDSAHSVVATENATSCVWNSALVVVVIENAASCNFD